MPKFLMIFLSVFLQSVAAAENLSPVTLNVIRLSEENVRFVVEQNGISRVLVRDHFNLAQLQEIIAHKFYSSLETNTGPYVDWDLEGYKLYFGAMTSVIAGSYCMRSLIYHTASSSTAAVTGAIALAIGLATLRFPLTQLRNYRRDQARYALAVATFESRQNLSFVIKLEDALRKVADGSFERWMAVSKARLSITHTDAIPTIANN